MHDDQLLCDWVLLAILLLRQSFDPPNFGKELANLLLYVLAILLGHESTISKIALHFTFAMSRKTEVIGPANQRA
jgi:hypothetical protein